MAYLMISYKLRSVPPIHRIPFDRKSFDRKPFNRNLILLKLIFDDFNQAQNSDAATDIFSVFCFFIFLKTRKKPIPIFTHLPYDFRIFTQKKNIGFECCVWVLRLRIVSALFIWFVMKSKCMCSSFYHILAFIAA